MIGIVTFKLLEKAALKYSGVELPEEAIYAIDSAFLGVTWLLGNGPKSVKSLLLTAGIYGVPAICRLFNQEKAAHYVEILPKVYSTVWMVYTAIFIIAMLLLVLGAYKSLPTLLNSLQSSPTTSSDSTNSRQRVSQPSSKTPHHDQGDEDTSTNDQTEGQSTARSRRSKRSVKE